MWNFVNIIYKLASTASSVEDDGPLVRVNVHYASSHLSFNLPSSGSVSTLATPIQLAMGVSLSFENYFFKSFLNKFLPPSYLN